MGPGPITSETDAAARERAQQLAPYPKWPPGQAGMVGAGISGIVLTVFLGFARLPSDAFPFAITVTICLGFALPYLILKRQEREFWKAYTLEYDALRKREGEVAR